MSNVVKISRRHVLKAGASIGVGCCMSVAGVASAQRRGALPTGQSGDILTLDTSVSYDLGAMAPGDMVAFQDGKILISPKFSPSHFRLNHGVVF